MQALLDPAILFFVLGVAAGLMKSNLDIPPQISRFLALYLLMALGLKGGFALANSGLSQEVAVSLLCAVLLAVMIPALGYVVLKKFLRPFDATAVAATYGSVSAVTFITAVQYMETHGHAFGAHMTAAMALMEAPAIILAMMMAARLRRRANSGLVVQGNAALAMNVGGAAAIGSSTGDAPGHSMRKVLHESFTDGAQLLLLGAMLVGLLSGDAGQIAMNPFSGELFKGMLAFFLLDMGLMAARTLPQLKGQSLWIFVYAIIAPVVHSALALGLACLVGLTAGNTALLMVLAASASYIAVPAVLRLSMPEAEPSLYFGMSLGITLPINILIGIPAYVWLAQKVVGS